MGHSMRAVVVARYGGRLEVMERPVPHPGAGEVLIRVRASGLCSTDLHLLSGRMPLGDLPCILGHESAGDIAELGRGSRPGSSGLTIPSNGLRTLLSSSKGATSLVGSC